MTAESDDFRWRETYFVLFSASRRPTIKQLERALARLHRRFQVQSADASEGGGIASVTLLAPQDHAAVEVNYLEGEELAAQTRDLLDELRNSGAAELDPARLNRLRNCDAGFEVMHFEQSPAEDDADESEFDPGALLMVLDALVDLTDGVGVDPQSGTLL
jgi:hypothetical protein